MQSFFLIVFFFISSISLFGADIYPYMIKHESNYNGYLHYEPEISKHSFLIETDWANDTETIVAWNNINTKISSALKLTNRFILDSKLTEYGLITLSRSNNNIILELIDSIPNIIKIIELPVQYNEYNIYKIHKYNNNYFVIASGNLYSIDINHNLNFQLIDKNVLQLSTQNNNSQKIIYLQKQNEIYFLCKYDFKEKRKNDIIIESSDKFKLLETQEKIVFITKQTEINESLIQIFDISNLKQMNSFWIDSDLDQIDVQDINNKVIFYYFTQKDGRIRLNKASIDEIEKSTASSLLFEPSVIEPIKLKVENNKVVNLFKNTIILTDLNLNIVAFQFYPVSVKIIEPEIFLINNRLILNDKYNSQLFEISQNRYWLLNKYSDLAFRYVFPITLSVIILILLQLFRHQKRIFLELIDLPSVGIIMEFDSAGRLVRANTKARQFINYHRGMPKRKIFSYYLSDKENNAIPEIINDALQNKIDLSRKIEITMNDSIKEWLCSTIVLRNVAGMFRGIVFTAIDITEQLERKRLTNWAQLAHDMQTNLSTIRLNAENLGPNPGDNISRKKKILHQVNVLMQRVRDIVTVGRSNELEKINASAADICISARSEFDESVFPDVTFNLKLEYFSFLCDNKKLIRAVRNAIENAIKALPRNKGTINVACRKEGGFALFSIKDTGSGMDEKTKNKMMQPYFTTAENKGGFGIGTMIMQHVAELHEGKIEVISEKGLGTEIIFKLPIINEK